MARPSDPMLKWLRNLVDERGLNTASLAQKARIPRARLRKIRTGTEPMLVDELMSLSGALEISPKDMGLAGEEFPDEVPAAEAATESESESEAVSSSSPTAEAD